MTDPSPSGLQPHYQTYTRQKCFLAYSEQAPWSVDLLATCEAVLSQPAYNLEVDYARKHFAADVPLRQKALELIANARYGIYDLSCWRQDDRSPWQPPRNVFIELGIAIALNRPLLLLRHASNRDLPLPQCLQSLSHPILEFSGTTTLKKILAAHLPDWIDTAPDTAWWNRYCSFGGRICPHREAHPSASQLGQQNLHCTIADGTDPCRPDFRSVIEDVLDRFGDVTYTYLDSLSLQDGYQFLLCSHCQSIRSSLFAIYRITPHTPAAAYIAIGISLALETQFDCKIPKILIAESVETIPSLLSGYEVITARNDKERKTCLKQFLPSVLEKIRQTVWKPRPLPFIETSIPACEEPNLENLLDGDEQTDDSAIECMVYVENLSSDVTVEDISQVWSDYGDVVQVYLPTDPNTGQQLHFALIEMKEISQAEESVTDLDGAEWMGLDIKARIAKYDDLIYTKSQSQPKTLEHKLNTQSEDNHKTIQDIQTRLKLKLEQSEKQLEFRERQHREIRKTISILERRRSHAYSFEKDKYDNELGHYESSLEDVENSLYQYRKEIEEYRKKIEELEIQLVETKLIGNFHNDESIYTKTQSQPNTLERKLNTKSENKSVIIPGNTINLKIRLKRLADEMRINEAQRIMLMEGIALIEAKENTANIVGKKKYENRLKDLRSSLVEVEDRIDHLKNEIEKHEMMLEKSESMGDNSYEYMEEDTH